MLILLLSEVSEALRLHEDVVTYMKLLSNTHTHAHARTRTHTHTHTHARTHACARAHTLPYCNLIENNQQIKYLLDKNSDADEIMAKSDDTIDGVDKFSSLWVSGLIS